MNMQKNTKLVICHGDWQGNNQLRGLEPTPNKKYISLIKEAVEDTYLIDDIYNKTQEDIKDMYNKTNKYFILESN